MLAHAAFLLLGTLAASVNARAVTRGLTNPTLKNSTLVAVASDPVLNRDSCGTVRWGSRALWTCRDTGVLQDGQQVNFFSSSASYSSINADHTVPLSPVPAGQPGGSDYPAAYLLYGDNKNESFYTILPDECGDNQGGDCGNGSRYAIWEQQPPLVTSQSGTLTGYTWIKRSIIENLTNQIPDPSATLYKVTGSDSQDTLPTVSVVEEEFYAENYFAYGEYGSLVIDSTAYLYAVNSNFSIALAQVPVASIEDKSQYQYYVDGAWTQTPPFVSDSSAYISVGGGGQGTFYYSPTWQQYVFIGQPYSAFAAVPQFVVSVSTSPEGPWTAPTTVLTVPEGNYMGIGAYSMQAHPEFSPGPADNAIYVTYTKQYENAPYQTPLILIEWN